MLKQGDVVLEILDSVKKPFQAIGCDHDSDWPVVPEHDDVAVFDLFYEILESISRFSDANQLWCPHPLSLPKKSYQVNVPLSIWYYRRCDIQLTVQ